MNLKFQHAGEIDLRSVAQLAQSCANRIIDIPSIDTIYQLRKISKVWPKILNSNIHSQTQYFKTI